MANERYFGNQNLSQIGGILSEASTGISSVTGDGTRLMWIPGHGAFRAGEINGLPTRWDDANIGTDSVAFGLNNQASGSYSGVFGGHNNVASGQDDSVFGGSSNTASGGSSATLGGSNNTASGASTIAIGSNCVASTGSANTAIGNAATASSAGGSSTAIGRSPTASGNEAMAIGRSVVASGTNSNAMGYGIIVSGVNSFGIGLDTDTTRDLAQDNSLSIMGGNVGVGTLAPNSTLHIQGSQSIQRTPVAAGNYNVLSTDYLIAKTAITALGDTITLPDPAATGIGDGKIFLIKDEAGTAAIDNITINATAGNIDGAATATINVNYGGEGFYTDGVDWFSFPRFV